jgi:hypothetical protein
VLSLLATVAEEGEETSKTLFYVAGSILTAFAVIVSVIGIRAHDRFPPTRTAANAVMGICALLVIFTMASAVITG